ncbi:hypothetical protein ACM64Y_08095 [Novispirillum sp. DQ9]|uniref:hypothetical protein n=1 Tax=Novispirillum sp. DQ9 TaxID=3398612 RepID=UPI003C79E248
MSMKTVAAISFNSNHSISMDVEDVQDISLGKPTQLDENQWACELILHTANGNVAVQMLADSPDRFHIRESEGLGEF